MLIEQIEVDLQGRSEQVKLAITWSGGFVSRHELVWVVQRCEQLSAYARLCARVGELRAEGKSMGEVTNALNAEGFHPPNWVGRFRGGMVAGFLARKHERAGEGHARRVTRALGKGGGCWGPGAAPGDAGGDAAPLAEGGLGACPQAGRGRESVGGRGVGAGTAAVGAVAPLSAGAPQPGHSSRLDDSANRQNDPR
jgi:hypothetical protein